MATKTILIAYFSHSGNTHKVAGQIQKEAGGDILEIQSVDKYPANYDATVKQARKELDASYTPELQTNLENVANYEVIFLGYPVWWGTYPMPVKSFLMRCDLTGKTIVPFCTHEGSSLGRSVGDIAKLCPKSDVRDGLAIRGSSTGGSQQEVSAWVKKLAF